MNIAWVVTWLWNIGAYTAVAQVGPCLGGNVGGDRRDDQWVRLLGLAPRSHIECRVMKPCSVATASGWPLPTNAGGQTAASCPLPSR